ncbi:hypothetical protein BC567DRAFT_224318 [Phyllosticta citribraziliensis]
MGELKFVHRRAARRDSLHEKEELPPTVQATARFLNRDPACLSGIRNLLSLQNLWLFTPYLPFPSKSDPFEPLGRALHAYHQEVRHTVYVPENGLTPTHLAFLQHAAAVVLVIFTNYPQERRRLPPVESLLKMDPAVAVADSHHHHDDDDDLEADSPKPPIEMLAPTLDGAVVLERLRELPTVLVLVDDDAESEEATAQVDELVTAMGAGTAVVRTQSYDEAALRRVADLLFE